MPPLHMFGSSTLDTQVNAINTPENNDIYKNVPKINEPTRNQHKYKWDIVWRNVIVFIILHIITLYGFYLIIFKNKWDIFIFSWVYGNIQGLGITAGAHRLWAHRSYKARLPLKLFLLICQTSSFQNSVYTWVRDHRLHHKFTDTDADPHNATRGFFFSHMGWLLVRKNKEVFEKGKCVDMSDITSDKLLMWQHRYYFPLMILFTFIVPVIASYCYFSHYGIWTNIVIAGIFRYIYSVHSTWLVNSAAHLWGMKPYDRTIGPSENKMVSFFAQGEGFHNYHHVFPWDYKTSELGSYSLNWTLAAINICNKIGLAYDCKTVPFEFVMRRATRTGDGSWNNFDVHSNGVWGWGDASISEEDFKNTKIIN